MSLIDTQLPMLSWMPKARESRVFVENGFLSAVSRTREAYRRAKKLNLHVPQDADNQADIAAVQFQIGRTKNLRFLPLDKDIDSIRLAENKVLFVPTSLVANRYITFYNPNYLINDIGRFVDPKGVQNTESFKTAPAWGRCEVYRSNHPRIKEGRTYYSFWPLAAYCVRSIRDVDSDGFVAYQDLPQFKGPREWEKIIRIEDDSHAIDTLEYMKIGLTFALEARELRFFGADNLVISSASSASGQLLAMFMKEINPSVEAIGLTSERNCKLVKGLSIFDHVYTYDDIKSCPNDRSSMYFDALGWESVNEDVFDHFKICRWWVYGEGGDRTFLKFLRKNRRGSIYTNLVDSYIYQIRNGISDAEILDQTRVMIEKYGLEEKWFGNAKVISTSKELFEIYHAYVDNTHSGERVLYRTPLARNAGTSS
jgi:hypothetical protein